MIFTKLESFKSQWTPIFTKMKDAADDIGDKNLDTLIFVVETIDKDIAMKNIQALILDMQAIEAVSKRVIQHINGHEGVKHVIAQKLTNLKPVMKRLEEEEDFNDLAEYFDKAATSIEDVMAGRSRKKSRPNKYSKYG